MASSGNKIQSLGTNFRSIKRQLNTSSSRLNPPPVTGNTQIVFQQKPATPTLDQIAPPEPNFPLPGGTTTLYSYKLSKLPSVTDTFTSTAPPLRKSPVLADKLPIEHQLAAIQTFGEMSNEAAQTSFYKETQTVKCRLIEAPFVAKRELVDLFPERSAEFMARPLTMATLEHKTVHDMAAWSPLMECERDELMGNMIDAATSMCESLRADGYWADFIDPASGRPYLGPFTNATLFETDGRFRHLGMDVEDLGCCKVLTHPEFGRHCFIGVIFTDAPIDAPSLVKMTEHMNLDGVPAEKKGE